MDDTVTKNVVCSLMKRKAVRDGLKSSIHEAVDECHKDGVLKERGEKVGKKQWGSIIANQRKTSVRFLLAYLYTKQDNAMGRNLSWLV